MKPFQRKAPPNDKSGKPGRRRRASVSEKMVQPSDNFDEDLTATFTEDYSMRDQSIMSGSSRRRGLQRSNSARSRRSAKSSGSRRSAKSSGGGRRKKGLHRTLSGNSRRSSGRGMLDFSGSRQGKSTRRTSITREEQGLAEMAELEAFFMKMAATPDGQKRLRNHVIKQKRASLAM